MVKKYADLYLETRRALMVQEDAHTAGLMARNLIALYSGQTQEYILANRELYAGEETCVKVEKAIKRLLTGEPLAYVLGEWEFYGLSLYVNENVLIPRDDTVAVAQLAINQAIFLPSNPRVLDLCTGSGCIGLAIASRIKDARVTLADISKDALEVAKKNIARHKMTGRVSCMQVDAMRPVQPFLGKFDMIVSNPPYITDAEMPELQDSVKLFEPHLALCGGADGLDFYRSIVENFSAALKPGGFLCFEFGEEQGDDICRILEANGYTILERSRDYNDTERAVLAQYGRKED